MKMNESYSALKGKRSRKTEIELIWKINQISLDVIKMANKTARFSAERFNES